MKTIILGLPFNVTECSIREIVLFLLFYSIVCVILGRFVNKTNIKNDYFSLVRYNHYLQLWRKWCGKIITLSLVMAGILFVGISCTNSLYRGVWLGKTAIMALILWFLGFCSIGLFFIFLQNVRHGESISFLCTMLIEVISIFYSQKLPRFSKFLIGNYVMLGRSNLYEAEGYSILCVITIISIAIVLFSLYGYRIVFRRKQA